MKIRHPLLTKLAAAAAVGSIKLLFRTVRLDFEQSAGVVAGYSADVRERYLFCVWHDSLLVPLFSRPPQNMAALVSRHQDGSYLADAMRMMNITPIRGSSSRGGAQAIKELLELDGGYHITITPDGPRGPRRKVKSGIVFLASHTGQAIMPLAGAGDNAWHIQGSWTDMLLPKPFSTLYGAAGDPLYVPPKLSRAGIEHYTGMVQQAMDELNAEVESWAKQGQRTAPRKRAAA